MLPRQNPGGLRKYQAGLAPGGRVRVGVVHEAREAVRVRAGVAGEVA